MTTDPRLTPARPDLAASHLEGKVKAASFVDARPARVRAPKTMLCPRPDRAGAPDTELLFGEDVDVYEIANGWAWVQSVLDGYVGYVPVRNLARRAGPVTHRVATLTAQVYARPELKIPAIGRLPFGARVGVEEVRDGYARIADERWIADPQLAPIDSSRNDWVAIAEMFEGVPYVWGGRSSMGLDCSALVQLSRQAAGHDCPRDSDMQRGALGRDLQATEPLKRGDLVFWKGHVGIMRNAKSLLHANAHHMAVALEPLERAVQRIAEKEFGEIVRRARLDGAASSP